MTDRLGSMKLAETFHLTYCSNIHPWEASCRHPTDNDYELTHLRCAKIAPTLLRTQSISPLFERVLGGGRSGEEARIGCLQILPIGRTNFIE